MKCWICNKPKKLKDWSPGKDTYIPANMYFDKHKLKISYAIIPQPLCKICLDNLMSWIKKQRRTNVNSKRNA